MNKIYKVIFNRVKGRYEVVSELAKNGGKASGNSLLRTFINSGGVLTKSILLSLLLLGTSYGANAAIINDGDTLIGSTNINVTKDDTTQTITITTNGLATTAELNTNKANIAANTAQIGTNTVDINTNKANIAANTVQIGINASAINSNKDDISDLKAVNTALGLDKNKVGMKYFRANSNGDDAYATGADAIAVGKNARASKDKAVAMGTQAEASGVGAIAIGAETKENGNSKGAEAAAENSVAIGSDAVVVEEGRNGIALGRGAITGARSGMTADDGSQLVQVGGGQNSISIGNGANARGNSAIALGDGAVVMNDATADNPITNNGIAIGTGSRTVSENGTAIGNGARVSGSSAGATAIGNQAKAQASDALAVGSGAEATYGDSVAIGSEAKSSYVETVAIGKSAESRGNQSIALGSGTTANADNVVSIGHNAVADAEYSIVMGEEAGKGMVGDKNHVNGAHVVIGKNAGQNIDGSEDISLGFGAGSNVKGNYNIAIGSGAGTYLGDNTTGSTQNSLAGYDVSLGYHANHYEAATSITEATALGANTVARTQSTAVGAVSKAIGNGATAMGFTSLAEGDKSMAIGEESIARDTGNVALGGGSLATAAMASGNAYLTGTTATQIVSVGNGASMSDNGLRRIVNVADGSADQDAVTVKQLKALQTDLSSQITNAHPGSSSGNAVTYSGTNNEYVSLKDNNNNAVQIKNVKDGVDAGDAVNKGQMDQAVSAAKVHYYSVKTDDTGTAKNNFNNDGAVGSDSLAMGVIAKATKERSVAVGNNVSAESDGSIAMGVGYKNTDGSISETKAETGYQYNTAIGAGAQSAGDNSLAIGTRAAVKQKAGSATNSSKESIAIGYLAETSDTRGVAMGAEAKSIAKGANAIGDRATASGTDSIAIGTEATDALSTNSIAMGTKANVQKGSSAAVIGNESHATNAVNANVFGTGSSIINGKDDDKVKDNSLVGNGNQIVRNDAQSVTNITVNGNTNTVQGITDSSSAADASKLDKINITGTNNTVTLSDNGLPIEDVTIMGNDNTVEAALKYDPDGKSLSNIQILGSNVTATLGNSVYLGTGSAATAEATAETAGAGEYNDLYAVAAKKADGVVTIGSKGHERRLQNVAAGLVSSTSTDAVNGSQLYLRTRPLRFAGDNSTLGSTAAADQNVLHRGSDEAMSILGGADDGNLSDNNIGVVADAANNKLTVKLSKDVKGLNSVTATTVNATMVNAGDTTMNDNGLTIKNGPSITKTGINAGGKTITNVAAGVNLTDGVNVSQLKSAQAAATTEVKAGKNVTVDEATGANGQKVYTVNADLSSVADALGGSSTVNAVTGKVEANLEVNGNTYHTVQEAVNAANTTVSSNDGSVKVTKSSNTNGSNNFDLAVDYTKVAENASLTYKANGKNEKTVSLKKGLDFTNGKNTTASVAADGVVKYDLNDDISLSSVTTGDTVINNTGLTVGGNAYVTKSGLNANGQKVVNVADGEISATSTDAVNGSQLHATNVEVEENTKNIAINKKNIQKNADNIAKGLNFAADSGTTYNAQLGDTVSVKGDGHNVSTSVDGSQITVKMSDTPSFTSVKAVTIQGNTIYGDTIKAGDTVTMNNQGIDMGDTKITHLHKGEVSATSTDAVNGSQLYGTETRITRLGNRINRVGAGAAALAGLHPLDFDPDDKWDFAAGYGNYKNANAVAIGAYYRPNEDTMFSVGGSFSGGENMVNVGVSWKFGQKSHISRSRVSMAKDMLAMKNQIETLTKKLANYESGQPVKLASTASGAMTFPDVPENHWAYEYVKSLAERGYLKGYPDGEFKGDRAMTRYEYAAIIYRALQNGAPSDGNMTRSVDEFGPELIKVQNIDRFRVDRISGKDNDRHKVERVRVNDKDDKAQNVFRDVYGSHIQK